MRKDKIDRKGVEKKKRTSLKIIGASAVTSGVATSAWQKPVVDTVIIPSHAMTTDTGGDADAGTTDIPVTTAGNTAAPTTTVANTTTTASPTTTPGDDGGMSQGGNVSGSSSSSFGGNNSSNISNNAVVLPSSE